MRAATALFCVAAFLPAVALAQSGATRADAARAFITFERALADHPPGPEDHLRVARRFDRLTHLTFRGRWDTAAREFDTLTAELLPPALDAPGDRAARATRATATPAAAVRGDDARIELELALLYDVPDRPGSLGLRLMPAEGEPREVGRFDPAGDRVAVPLEGLAAGRYEVQAVTDDGNAWGRGTVTVLDRRPSDVRAELDGRLAAIELPEDRPDLRRSLAAARSRAALLADDADPNDSSSLVADLAALSREVPAEVAALERGEDPYRGKAGDYWRTFTDVDGPPLRVPARVYVPPSATRAMAAGEQVPLLVALHGAGGDEHIFMEGYGAGLVKALAQEHGFVVVSPLTYPALTDGRALPLVVGTLRESYDIDPDRVYALGHSLGAITAAGWAFREPETLAGVALIAGGGRPARVEAGGAPATFVAAAGRDGIFRVDRLRSVADAAEGAGAPAKFELYADEGHVSVVPASMPEAVAWLLRHRRAAAE